MPRDNASKDRLHAKADFDHDWPLNEKSPVHNHYYEIKQNQAFNFGNLAFGLVLVMLGLVYLAINTGWLPADFRPDLWKLWPLLIIFAGLSLIRGTNLANFLIGSIITLTALALSVLMIFGSVNPSQQSGGQDLSAVYQQGKASETVTSLHNFNIPLDSNQRSLAVTISGLPGQIELSGQTEAAIEGELETNYIKLNTISSVSDGRQNISLSGQGGAQADDNHINRLNFKLHRNTDTLEINGAEADLKLDLKNLALSRLTINGSRDSYLALTPRADSLRLDIDQSGPLKLSLAPETSLKFVGQTEAVAKLTGAETTADGVLLGNGPADYIINLKQVGPVSLE